MDTNKLLDEIAKRLGHGESELKKQTAIVTEGKNLVVGDFYDWLRDVKGYWICERTGKDYQPFVPIREGPEELIADYFGVDLMKVELEKRELLEWISDQHK